MTTIYDIPHDMLIKKVAGELKNLDAVQAPEWAMFVKTGVHKQAPPEDEDWWYTRAAAVLRRVYIDGPVGVQRMRTFYGGKKDRGSSPYRFRRGSGSVLRTILQQLEEAGFVEHGAAGRKITPAGRAFLDNIAEGLKPEAAKAVAGLDKY
jgi:small subunit ribosomal protein S19e